MTGDPHKPIATAPVTAAGRLVALDLLRGLVMALMALDHVDAATNPDHARSDSVMLAGQGPLSAPDFLTRWCTHLCAPTFVCLAGVGLALSAERARRRGEPMAQFDRHVVRRAAVLLLLELLVFSHFWRFAEEGLSPWTLTPFFFQVLYALGGGMLALVVLRRLPDAGLVAVAAALLVGCELARLATLGMGMQAPLAVQLLAVPGFWSWTEPPPGQFWFDAIVLYPLLPWLPVMLLGHVLGRQLAAGRFTARSSLVLGLGSLALWALLRGIDGFGNMALHRRSGDVLEWLHCSKYPPSVTFLAMELGIALVLLAALLRVQERLARWPSWNPLLVLGQVPLFFYVIHLPLIGLLLWLGVLPARGAGSAAQSWLGAALVVLASLPLCAGYRFYKQRWQHAWTRYL